MNFRLICPGFVRVVGLNSVPDVTKLIRFILTMLSFIE